MALAYSLEKSTMPLAAMMTTLRSMSNACNLENARPWLNRSYTQFKFIEK